MQNEGIIFFEFINNTLQLYLSMNNDDKYEDIKISQNIKIFENINTLPLYKFYDDMNKNIIYFLDIDKYEKLYNDILQNKKYKDKIININLDKFIKPSIHKYAKINKLKNSEIETILDKIRLNYIIRKKLIHHL